MHSSANPKLKNGEQSFEDFPSDIYLNIASHCDSPDSLLVLSQVSKAANVGSKESKRYAFFNSHSYVTFTPQLRYYLLNTKNMTALNVYEGKLMVEKAINLYLAGNFISSYSTFYNAMCEHGSSTALLILAELFDFSEKVTLKLDHVRIKHEQCEKTIAENVTNEHRKTFNIPQYEPLIPIYTNYIHFFYKVTGWFYEKDKAISKNNISALKKDYDERVSVCDWADRTYDAICGM